MDRGPGLRLEYDPETFGRFSEKVARFFGTWRFILWMTLLIIAWIVLNVVLTVTSPEAMDPYPFIFLTLLLSLQASYAAPLILLAQNRQDDRDRVQWAEDRDRSERLVADTEYIVREVATLRLALGEAATRDYVRSELRGVLEEIRDLLEEDQVRKRESKKTSKKRKGDQGGESAVPANPA